MSNGLTNYVHFAGIEGGTGNIASLTYDIDITLKAHVSTNPKAPVHEVLARTPRGCEIRIGGVWENQNQEGGTYLTLAIDTGHGRLRANLGRYPGQDDTDLKAITRWD